MRAISRLLLHRHMLLGRHHNTAAAAASSSFPGVEGPSVDPAEAAKFAALSSTWWDPAGPFAPLHRLNPARCKFIRDAVCSARSLPRECPQPLHGMRALDVGCGGGILAESLARMGASVHAIDVAPENTNVAQLHSELDPLIRSRVRYECVPAEALHARGETYDLVVASEVIEHVRRPDQFVQVLAGLMRPSPPEVPLRDELGGEGGCAASSDSGGEGSRQQQQQPPSSQASSSSAADSGGESRQQQPPSGGSQASSAFVDGGGLLILSTINRTIESFAVAIIGAEYLTGMVPRGTHEWDRFITPQELALMAAQVGLHPRMMAGISLSARGLLQLTDRTGVNYIASFSRNAA